MRDPRHLRSNLRFVQHTDSVAVLFPSMAGLSGSEQIRAGSPTISFRILALRQSWQGSGSVGQVAMRSWRPLPSSPGMRLPTSQRFTTGSLSSLDRRILPLGSIPAVSVVSLIGFLLPGRRVFNSGRSRIWSTIPAMISLKFLMFTGSIRLNDQKRPSISPASLRWIDSAAGTRGRPGIVMISPQMTTTNPAPAARRTSRTGIV